MSKRKRLYYFFLVSILIRLDLRDFASLLLYNMRLEISVLNLNNSKVLFIFFKGCWIVWILNWKYLFMCYQFYMKLTLYILNFMVHYSSFLKFVHIIIISIKLEINCLYFIHTALNLNFLFQNFQLPLKFGHASFAAHTKQFKFHLSKLGYSIFCLSMLFGPELGL